MGIYGAGKAFNLRYAQNTFVPNRGINVRQSRQPIMFGSHCHCAPTNTNVTINNGPTGFWGFMSGLFGGLFGGGMMGGLFNNIGGYSPFGMINAQQAQPQQPQGNNELANLEKMYSKYKVLPNGNGTYTITKGEGDNVKTGTYDELIKGLDQSEKKVDNENGKVDDDKTKVDDDTTGGKKVDDDTAGGKTKVDDGTTGGGKAGEVQGSGSGVKSSGGSGIKKGWYRAANDNSATIQASKGKNASQLTANLLGTKLMGALTPAQQKTLTQEIIKQNPSVFDKDGNPKPGADYSKLDVPKMEWIKTEILKETAENRSSERGPNSARGRAMKQTSTVGNNQYYTNFFAQKGYRETDCKGIYFKDGKHYRLEGNKLYEIKQDVKQVLKDGRWYDSKGKLHQESLTQSKPTTNAASHPANNGKTHTGGRQPWL